jgi:hypothetical protein
MNSEPNDTEAELAALADGTLPPARHAQALDRVHESPELADRLAAQCRAIASMRALESVAAPDALRRSIEAQASAATTRVRTTEPSTPPTPRRPARARLRLAGAAALGATAVVALALALTTTSPSAPTVLQASRLALRPATLAAPAESAHNRGLLASSVEGVPFPYWGGTLGWQAAGARIDRLAGHTVRTVLYVDGRSRRIAYAIVAGRPLPIPTGAGTVARGGVRYRVLTSGGVTVLTWRQAGHTCILAARGVDSATLLHLASWQRS